MSDRSVAQIPQLSSECTGSRCQNLLAESFPTAASAIEAEVQEAVAIYGGDAIAALRITLSPTHF